MINKINKFLQNIHDAIFGRYNNRCDEEVYNNGKIIAVLIDINIDVLETWIKKIAKDSGQRLDWFFVAGRVVVKAVGDLKRVDRTAYWQDGNKLKNFGGAVSCYGYFPGGENHWSKV